MTAHRNAQKFLMTNTRDMKLKNDLARLKSILDMLTVPDAHILSLGCGQFMEAEILHAWKARQLPIGVDFDGEALRGAVGMVVQADGARLPFRENQFSLILIRHPDIALRPEGWRRMLLSAPDYLASGGVILVTTYAADEHEFARRCLNERTPLPLPESRFAPPDLSGSDRYVCAFTR